MTAEATGGSQTNPQNNTERPMEKKIVVELTETKQCGPSVRFDTPKTKGAPQALSNIYVNRTFPAINTAKKVRVTIEVVE